MLQILERNESADCVISVKEAVRQLGLCRLTLHRMHQRGEGPKRIRLSAGRIGYRQSDIDKWLKSQEI